MPKLVDTECWDLANYFLCGCIVKELRTPAQVEADKQSLAEAIQEAVEDWFAANPIEVSTAIDKAVDLVVAEVNAAAAADVAEFERRHAREMTP